MVKNKLVVNRKFYDSINEEKNFEVINSFGYADSNAFFIGICNKLNDEYDFTKLDGIRFQTDVESKKYKMFSAFIEGNVTPYKQVVISFTPIISKLGNTNIVQEIMPMIANQMEENISFLLDNNIKKICMLTSLFNKQNILSKEYNTLQLNVNSLNTLKFDVIQFFPVIHLTSDSFFNSLTEYLDMTSFLQHKNLANDQFEYFKLENNTLYGRALASQIKGQWQKTFAFKFITAIFSGKKNYKYDISGVLRHNLVDNQLQNLSNFIDFVNNNDFKFDSQIDIPSDDVIDSNDDIIDMDNVHREPQQGTNKNGRKRYKTQRKIRDSVIKSYGFICDCHDRNHFYFESSDSYNNYVEGHHIIPMNRQEEYWNEKKINLDVISNIVPLCPNCHSQIHLGSRKARLEILSEIFIRDEAKLKSMDSNISLIKLVSYYNIGLNDEEANYLLANAKIKVHNKKYGIV